MLTLAVLRPDRNPDLAHYALRRRLLVLILLPLALVGLLNAWADYRSAGNAAALQDEQLTRLLPLLANAVLSPSGDVGIGDSVVMLAPDIQQFLLTRGPLAAFRVSDKNGNHMAGNRELRTVLPLADEVELHSETAGGVTWRTAVQRMQLAEGQTVIVQLSDASDPRQRWLQAIAKRVLFPNLLLALAMFFAVNWGVRRALAPLVDLRRQVESRAPQDLSPINVGSAPLEVSPLVQALNRLFANAQQQSAAQQRFVADAAHQLRTPLAALHTEAQTWVQRSAQTPQAAHVSISRESVYRLEQATRRAANLAHQLLTLSRAETGQQALVLQRVDLVDLFEDVLAMRLDAAGFAGADFGLDTPGRHVAAAAMAEPWMLRELLLNLVDNALAYAGPNPIVTLQLQVGESHAQLSVLDNGPGIDINERTLVLERFHRGSSSMASPGNGLGLAIAQEIAQRHGSILELADAHPAAIRPGLKIGLSLPLCENS